MQNPNEDTQWNDVLRSKGILPPRDKDGPTIDEDTVVKMVEETVEKRTGGGGGEGGRQKALEDMTLDELDEVEDEEEERALQRYRQQRMAEILAHQQKAIFGSVKEISAADYIQEVNKAGEDVWVVLHLYNVGIPLCALVNQHIQRLAQKFPATKFLKSISTVCIPNYPNKNLPTIFIYCNEEMKGQLVGPVALGGMSLTVEELEWMLAGKGALKTDLEEDPRKKSRGEIRDVMKVSIRGGNSYPGDSDDD